MHYHHHTVSLRSALHKIQRASSGGRALQATKRTLLGESHRLDLCQTDVCNSFAGLMATATFNSAQKPELPPKLLSTLSQVERFAQSPFTYASWTPAQQVWSSREAQRIDSLQLPKTSELAHRTADPDLVLYGLGRMHELDAAYPSRLDSLAADQSHT